MNSEEIEAKKEQILARMQECNNKCTIALHCYRKYQELFADLSLEYKELDKLQSASKLSLVVSKD